MDSAGAYFRDVQTREVKYQPLIRPDDQPPVECLAHGDVRDTWDGFVFASEWQRIQPIRRVNALNAVRSLLNASAPQMIYVADGDSANAGRIVGIDVDPGIFRQALLNLAKNAVQAMPNGGTLTMATSPTKDGRVEIRVSDTGVGIPPEHLSRIFDLYFTTKEKGSGIGLSMVYRIVQLHDGEVEVESTPGSGTRFRLMFPQA